jgi:hypothetical protein
MVDVRLGQHVEWAVHMRVAADLDQVTRQGGDLRPGEPPVMRCLYLVGPAGLRSRQVERRPPSVRRQELEHTKKVGISIVERHADGAGVRANAGQRQRLSQPSQGPALGSERSPLPGDERTRDRQRVTRTRCWHRVVHEDRKHSRHLYCYGERS